LQATKASGAKLQAVFVQLQAAPALMKGMKTCVEQAESYSDHTGQELRAHVSRLGVGSVGRFEDEQPAGRQVEPSERRLLMRAKRVSASL
jgi:hypothetical protein